MSPRPVPGPRRPTSRRHGQPEVIAVDLDEVINQPTEPTQPDAEATGGTSARRPGGRPADPEAAQLRRDRVALREIRVAQQTVLEAIRAAETKATSLLGLFGATLAAALVLATRTGLGGFAAVMLALATGPLLGSVLALLAVLRAGVGVEHGFGRWARLHRHPDALIDHLTLPLHCQVAAQARRLAELSALAVAKVRRINLAIALLAGALPLLALAALTA